MFDQIEKLKRELTDQFVVVSEGVPELKRFDGYVGQVKTVNMNGRALVQFEAWNNIGWYDIDVECLKVVSKPTELAVAESKKPAAKPVAPTNDSKPAAPATGEKKLSPLEMARMQGAVKTGGAAAATKPAAAPAGAKKSTADILAAARAKKTTEAAAPAAVVEEPPPAPAAAPKPAAAKPAEATAKLTPGQRLSVPEILVWCRQHDAK